MNIKQIENLYKINGRSDYLLKNTEDLLKIHGIDYREIKGYNTLDDINKARFNNFIIAFLNAWGLEERISIVPKNVHWVKDIEYLVKVKDDSAFVYPPTEDDFYYVTVGRKIYAISKDGTSMILYKWMDDDYKDNKAVEKSESFYLRFEYKHNGSNEWQHIYKDGSTWG